MSSANITLKTSDVTIFPYRASKTYILSSSLYSANDIIFYSGSNTTLSPTGSLTQGQLFYKSIRHLYYSNILSSSAIPEPLSSQNYAQLVTDSQIGRAHV